MMKVLFNNTHRKTYGEKAIDFSFLAIGALIFGQILSEKAFLLPLLVIGLILFIVGIVISYLLLKGIKGGGDK